MMRRVLSILSGKYMVNAKHYIGMPSELTAGIDQRTLIGTPAFVVIEQEPEGIFLFRYDSKGECVGDTWHKTMEEAQDQAFFEYQMALGEWQDVPPEVQDVIAFGLAALKQ